MAFNIVIVGTIILPLKCLVNSEEQIVGKLVGQKDPEHLESVVQWLILTVHPDEEGKLLRLYIETQELQQESRFLFRGSQ